MTRGRVALGAACVALVFMLALSIWSLLNPSDNADTPPVVGPSMPPGYAVDWVPVGDRVYPCIRNIYKDSISCDFSRPSPTPSPGSTRS